MDKYNESHIISQCGNAPEKIKKLAQKLNKINDLEKWEIVIKSSDINFVLDNYEKVKKQLDLCKKHLENNDVTVITKSRVGSDMEYNLSYNFIESKVLHNMPLTFELFYDSELSTEQFMKLVYCLIPENAEIISKLIKDKSLTKDEILEITSLIMPEFMVDYQEFKQYRDKVEILDSLEKLSLKQRAALFPLFSGS